MTAGQWINNGRHNVICVDYCCKSENVMHCYWREMSRSLTAADHILCHSLTATGYLMSFSFVGYKPMFHVCGYDVVICGGYVWW